jgi:hypothetical protein
VAASIAGHYRKIFREDIDNFAFALVAPLSADNDRGLTLIQVNSSSIENRQRIPAF